MELCRWQKAKFINNVCVAFVALYAIIICTNDINKPEKKDQVLKTYSYVASYISWLSFL